MSVLLSVLIASLVGSLHCAGMCGPLVPFVLGDPDRQSWALRARLQVAYHGGRLASYALVGAVCGLAGAAIDQGAARWGVHSAAAILAGAMMIVAGGLAVLRYSGVRAPQLPLPGVVHRLVATGQRAAIALRPLPRALGVGLLSAFLPCGWLYMFALVAAGTGSPLWGALIMAAFWLGTVPVLVFLGIGIQTLAGTLGRRIPLITAVAIVVLGVSTIVLRAAAPREAFSSPIPLDSAAGAAEQVDAIRHATPPCCQHHGR